MRARAAGLRGLSCLQSRAREPRGREGDRGRRGWLARESCEPGEHGGEAIEIDEDCARFVLADEPECRRGFDGCRGFVALCTCAPEALTAIVALARRGFEALARHVRARERPGAQGPEGKTFSLDRLTGLVGQIGGPDV